MKFKFKVLSCLLATLLSLPVQAKDASPDFLRMLADLASSFRVAASSNNSLTKCERLAATQANAMMKQRFVFSAASTTIFEPMANTLKALLATLGLGPIIELADLANAYLSGGDFKKELAKIILGKLTDAGWEKIRTGTNTSLEDFVSMETADKERLVEKYITEQLIGAGSGEAVDFMEDPKAYFESTLGDDEFTSWETQFSDMGATWDKSTGRIYVNIIIRRKCPNPTDLERGRVQIWGQVKAVTLKGKTSYKATLTRYKVQGICCGQDWDTRYPPEENEDQKRAKAEAQKALKKTQKALDEANGASGVANGASNGSEATEAADLANNRVKEAQEALDEAEAKVKEAKKTGADTTELERDLARKQRLLDEARAGAKSATVAANDQVLSEDEAAAKECAKAIADCEAAVKALKDKLEAAKKAAEGLKKESEALDKEAGSAQNEIDDISKAEQDVKDAEAELQRMAAEAGVETRQGADGRTNIMGKVGDIDSATWNKLVAKRKECTKAHNALKALKKKKKEAEDKKKAVADKKAALNAKMQANAAEQEALEKQIAEKEEACAKKRKNCEKKRLALIKKIEDFSKADGVARPIPEHLKESHLKEEDEAGRRDRVAQAQQSLTDFFTALEQENLSALRESLSEGFVTQDRLALAQARAVFLQASRLQFNNLSGTQYRVDVGPFRIDRSGKTAQVDLRWNMRSRFQQSGQEWLVQNQETTVYFEEQEDVLKLVVLQGDPLLRTNDFGITLVDEGSVDLTPVTGPFGLYSGSPVTQPEFLAGFPVNISPTATGSTVVPPVNIRPDLTLLPGTLTITPPNPQAGQSVTAQVVIQNTGQALSPPAQVGIFLNGQLAGQQMVTVLQPGQQAPVAVVLNGLAAGTFSTQARVDFSSQIAEANENNNTVNGPPLTVSAPPVVDMVAVPGTVQYNPASPQVNQMVQVTFTARNAGNTAAPSTTAGLAFNGTPVANQAVPPLAPGQSTQVQFVTQAPPNPGNVQVQVAVDINNQAQEANEQNNTTQGPNLVVQPGPPVGQADLIINQVTINGVPAPGLVNVQANIPFNVQMQVQNVGNAASTPTDAVVILIRGGGLPIGPVMVPAINAGQSVNLNFQGILPTAGPPSPTDAMVDPGNNVPESNEANNGRPGPDVQVQP